MADTEIDTENEDVVIEESATVDILRDQEPDNHTEELKRRALTMFTQVNVPVRDRTTNSALGFFTVMECNICSNPVLPNPKSLIVHMRQHLKAERRGDYG